MNQILKDLVKIAKQQLFGEDLPRQGKLVLTQKAVLKMAEWALSREGLELTYQYGLKTTKENKAFQIVREYKYYSIGLWYVEQWRPVKGTANVEKVCLILTCWKGGVRA